MEAINKCETICENCGKPKSKLRNGQYICNFCRKNKKCHICRQPCHGYYCNDCKGKNKGRSLSPSKIRQRKEVKRKYEENKKNKQIV